MFINPVDGCEDSRVQHLTHSTLVDFSKDAIRDVIINNEPHLVGHILLLLDPLECLVQGELGLRNCSCHGVCVCECLLVA